MLRKIEIDHWQSLKRADLLLGRLTVIVGPSSSGKTALIRALKALTTNVRGTGNITRGAKAFSISAVMDTATVTLVRSTTSGRFHLRRGDEEETFAKLAGGVPEQILRALNLDPALNFAGQFDRPYLLDDNGSSVAKVIGQLTNVDLVLTAAQEANRRRGRVTSELKTRLTDIEQTEAQLREHLDLPEQIEKVTSLEREMETLFVFEQRVARLRDLLAPLQAVEPGLTEPPTIDAVVEARVDLDRLKAALREVQALDAAAAGAGQKATAYEGALRLAEQELATALQAAAVCPTCGQRVVT